MLVYCFSPCVPSGPLSTLLLHGLAVVRIRGTLGGVFVPCPHAVLVLHVRVGNGAGFVSRRSSLHCFYGTASAPPKQHVTFNQIRDLVHCLCGFHAQPQLTLACLQAAHREPPRGARPQGLSVRARPNALSCLSLPRQSSVHLFEF